MDESNSLLFSWENVSQALLEPRFNRAVPAVMVNHNVRYSGDIFLPSWMDGIQINDSNLSELCAEGENIFTFFFPAK